MKTWTGPTGIELPEPHYCDQCGSELVLREQPEDGMRPWCPTCKAWRYPTFSTAVSVIVLNPDDDSILTIDQYGKEGILVAGYVLRGDSLEETVRREVEEETGLVVTDVTFNASQFFARSNTLMVNFWCRATAESVSVREGEVDAARWIPRDAIVDSMLPESLAQWFVMHYLESVGA